MNIHKNARLTPRSRDLLVRRVLFERQSPMSVATDMGVSLRTVAKWVRRFEAEGESGLADRSSRPRPSIETKCEITPCLWTYVIPPPRTKS